MNAIALDITAAAASTPDEMREAALEHMARADALRAQADEEERLAWRLRADAAVAEAPTGSAARPRRRPPVIGAPGFSINRVIALMEKLCIDEHVHGSDGLDQPLRLVERRLGIGYEQRAAPPIGARISNCETALGMSSR